MLVSNVCTLNLQLHEEHHLVEPIFDSISPLEGTPQVAHEEQTCKIHTRQVEECIFFVQSRHVEQNHGVRTMEGYFWHRWAFCVTCCSKVAYGSL